MLLILSNHQDATANYVVGLLAEHGVEFVRFDTDRSLDRATFRYTPGSPTLCIEGRWFAPRDFTNVWYRRPERLHHSAIDDTPEGKLTLDEWAECLEGFFSHIPEHRWMNHPSTNFGASHKLEQLTTATRLGFSIPDTLATQDVDQLRQFFVKCRGKMIAKPLSVGYVEREDCALDTLIYTNRVEEQQLDNLTDLPYCPTLFQECIEKAFDVRITIVDRDIHAISLSACEADGTQRCDIRRNNMDDVSYRKIEIPEEVKTKLFSLVDHYGLRFAAIDMALTMRGEWIFFEVNPNGQWAWMDLAGASNIGASFIRSFKVTPE